MSTNTQLTTAADVLRLQLTDEQPIRTDDHCFVRLVAQNNLAQAIFIARRTPSSAPKGYEILTILDQKLNLEETKQLCFFLTKVDFENLGGEGKIGKLRELYQLLERRGQLDELAPAATSINPSLSWLFTAVATPVPQENLAVITSLNHSKTIHPDVAGYLDKQALTCNLLVFIAQKDPLPEDESWQPFEPLFRKALADTEVNQGVHTKHFFLSGPSAINFRLGLVLRTMENPKVYHLGKDKKYFLAFG